MIHQRPPFSQMHGKFAHRIGIVFIDITAEIRFSLGQTLPRRIQFSLTGLDLSLQLRQLLFGGHKLLFLAAQIFDLALRFRKLIHRFLKHTLQTGQLFFGVCRLQLMFARRLARYLKLTPRLRKFTLRCRQLAGNERHLQLRLPDKLLIIRYLSGTFRQLTLGYIQFASTLIQHTAGIGQR